MPTIRRRSIESAHRLEALLEDVLLADITELGARIVDPLLFESVLGGAVDLIIDAEFSGGEIFGELEGGLVVGHIVLCFVDGFPGAAFFRPTVIKGTSVEHDALAEAFDDAEAVMQDRTSEDFFHVLHLRGMRAGDEGGTAGEELLHRIDRTVDAASGVGLALETDGAGRAGLLLGQAIDEVIHDDVGELDVFAGGVVEVIAADGETVAVTAEDEDMHIRTAQRDAGGKRQGTAMNEMDAVRVHEIRETAGAADAGDADDVFMRILELFQHAVEDVQHGEVAAAGAPRGMVGSESFFRELVRINNRRCRCRSDGGGHDVLKLKVGDRWNESQA